MNGTAYDLENIQQISSYGEEMVNFVYFIP